MLAYLINYVGCQNIKEKVYVYLNGESTYFAAFSYIRNLYTGSSMDVTRTVFTKAMFA